MHQPQPRSQIDPFEGESGGIFIVEEYVCARHVLRLMHLRVRVEEYIQTRRDSDIVRGAFFIERRASLDSVGVF